MTEGFNIFKKSEIKLSEVVPVNTVDFIPTKKGLTLVSNRRK